jgi:hypothetical protein
LSTSAAELMFEGYRILCVRILGRVVNMARVVGRRSEPAGSAVAGAGLPDSGYAVARIGPALAEAVHQWFG